ISETTSPSVTIFPKILLPTCIRILDFYLAKGPYLLVGVPGLPRGSYNVELEVGDVASHQAGLPSPAWNHPHLAYRGRQDAALGASEGLGAALVLELYGRITDVRERERSSLVRRLRVPLCERPALQGEVRSAAAKYTPIGVIFQRKSRVRTGPEVRLQLIEGGLYVRVPLLLIQAVTVEVEGHHELAEVRGLLDLQDQGVGPEGMQDATRHVHSVTRRYVAPQHHGVVILRLESLEEVIVREVLLYTGEYRRALSGPQDVPGLRFPVELTVFLSRRLVVGMQVDGEQVGGVEEFDQEREMRPAPALPHELVRKLLDDLVQRASRVGTVYDRPRRLFIVADLPGLGHHAVGRVDLA